MVVELIVNLHISDLFGEIEFGKLQTISRL